MRHVAMRFDASFSPSAVEHLALLTATERSAVLRGIEQHLAFDPIAETRNRKRLRPNPIAPWQLRLGHLRVFYEVTTDRPEVHVLAIGKKTRNVLRVAGRDIKL